MTTKSFISKNFKTDTIDLTMVCNPKWKEVPIDIHLESEIGDDGDLKEFEMESIKPHHAFKFFCDLKKACDDMMGALHQNFSKEELSFPVENEMENQNASRI